MRVCIAPSRLLSQTEVGGHAWAYLNWALGLQANGCEVTILECRPDYVDGAEVTRRIRELVDRCAALGLRTRVALWWPDDAPPEATLGSLEPDVVPLETVVDESDLLINFFYYMDPDLVARFRRTALLDIDPGLLQVWVSEGQFEMARHDIYFTIGETVGRPGALFPDCGVDWHYTPPAVYLPAWPQVGVDGAAPYTTVASWWSEWVEFRGEVFDNEKRTSFLDYLDLPASVPVPLELALSLAGDIGEAERETLEARGWRVRYAAEVAGSPEAYRSYIQRSRGEFSCAKPSCMRLRNAWISDRSLCYLASGKPVVVQHTGSSRFLPDGDGLFRFRDPEEAVRAFETVEADYAFHCRQARGLAEAHFDAVGLAGGVLERALAVKPVGG